MLIILRNEDKPRSLKDYDKFVCAEILDLDKDQELFQTVSKNMIHGPYGSGYLNSSCIKNYGTSSKCSIKYPKTFFGETRDGHDRAQLQITVAPQESSDQPTSSNERRDEVKVYIDSSMPGEVFSDDSSRRDVSDGTSVIRDPSEWLVVWSDEWRV
ncbi:hypothetical protein EVAR_95805_1 [Eumeta japonica]|uniref:Uncharacterized protein n=1 Tax=Eumeta variegata TaxID=151549 RepID=A0A4C1W4Q2_EUMVA|nr:hypothetical protein EVAR_95805_1 [Eumeta japonica]